MRIIEISSLVELIKFEDKFKYFENFTNYFQSFEFILNFINFHKANFLITLIEDKNNFIILPFSNFKFKTINFYGFIGSPDIGEENDLIHNFNDFDKFSILLDVFFKKNNKRFYFCNLKDGFFKKYLSNKRKFNKLNSIKSNIIDIEENYYLNKKSIDKSIAYDLRKFEKDFGINEKSISIKNISTEEAKKYDIFKFISLNKKVKTKKFLKIVDFLIKNLKNNFIKISILKTNKFILSIIIYVIYRNKLYYLIPVYNKKFKKFSFGKIHLEKLINHNKSKNIKKLFLGPGEELYKKKFNTSKEKLHFFTNSNILKFLFKFKFFLKGQQVDKNI